MAKISSNRYPIKCIGANMALTKEEKNKEQINIFLEYNSIDPDNATGYNNNFGTAYYVGGTRKFAEETPVGFSTASTSYVNVALHDINDIEFETDFKVTEQTFNFDEEFETLTITGNNPNKHKEDYKVVISSIYLDF